MSVWMSKAEKVAYVKRQHQSRPHTCHWPGCGRQVPPALWGCSFHWRQLPQDLRAKIWTAYVPGQEKTMTPSRIYMKACEEVEKFFQDAGIITLKTGKIVGEKSHDAKSTGEVKVMAKKAANKTDLPAAHLNALTSQIHALEVQITLIKDLIGVKSKKPKDEDVEEEDGDEETEQDEDEEESEEEDEEESTEEEDEDSEEEESGDEDGDADEDDSSAKKGPKKEAVVKALKTYAAKGAKFKDKAMAALGSFKSAAGKKIKHVDDMQKKDYALLLKKLK